MAIILSVTKYSWSIPFFFLIVDYNFETNNESFLCLFLSYKICFLTISSSIKNNEGDILTYVTNYGSHNFKKKIKFCTFKSVPLKNYDRFHLFWLLPARFFSFCKQQFEEKKNWKVIPIIFAYWQWPRFEVQKSFFFFKFCARMKSNFWRKDFSRLLFRTALYKKKFNNEILHALSNIF